MRDLNEGGSMATLLCERGARPVANAVRWQWVAVCVLLLALALGFQGARGLADPDEGFYTNVALGMVETGDWWTPRLNGDLFLDKPPMLYWGIGLGVRLFGRTEWAARAAQGLWFAATAVLVGLIGRELWGRKFGPSAALGYGLTLGPWAGGNVLTPDTVLCFWTTFSVFAYWRFVTWDRARQRLCWGLLLGFGLGCGLLAKGPAVLLIVPPLFVHIIWTRGWRSLLRVELLLIAATALAVGGSWYLAVGIRVEGAFSYWFDNQIAGRLWSDTYNRNPQWWGSLRVYAPALLVGTIPWTPVLISRGVRWLRRYRRAAAPHLDPKNLLLVLWFTLPMAVLLVARSRLTLYILPVLPPLVLLAVRFVLPQGRFRVRPRWAILLAAWMVAAMGLKFAAAQWPTYKDTRLVARGLASAGVPPSTPIVMADTKKNALRFYGYENLTHARLWVHDYPYFVRWRTAETVFEAIKGVDRFAVVCKRDSSLLLSTTLLDFGFSCAATPLALAHGLLDCRSVPIPPSAL